jgi:hypothetical protein
VTNGVSKNHETPEAAAQALLVEACGLLEGLHFVVVGGWVPVLRARHATLRHPGTRDVDLLFEDDPTHIAEAVRRLRSGGFLLSAKHRFQLLKPMRVCGEDLIFNVDLMHPLERGERPELFRDIMDLGIPDLSEPDGMMKVKSICFSASTIIFGEKLWSSFAIPGASTVPLMEAAGLIVSKCTSVKNPKRERDAFDIYMTLTAEDGAETAAKVKALARKYAEVEEQTDRLGRFLGQEARIFDKNVAVYARGYAPEKSPAEAVKALLFT